MEISKNNPLFYSIGSRLRLPYFLSSLRSLRPGTVCMDLGSGTGFFSDILSKRANKVYAIDPDQLSLDKGRQLYSAENIRFIVASAEKIPLEDNQIDFFICSEVLEHVENLEQTMKEIVRVSKDGTKFFITVPSRGIFGDFFLNIGHDEDNDFEAHSHPLFTKKGIVAELTKYNFKIEECYYSKFIIAEAFMGLTKIVHNFKKKKEISGQHDIMMPPKIYKILFPAVYVACRLEDFFLRHLPVPGHMVVISGKIKK